MTLLEIILQITFTTIGQLLLKKGSLVVKPIYLNGYIFIGYSLFIVVILISYDLMKKIDFMYFSVIMSINYVTVLFASRLVFQDSLNKEKFLGTLLVAVGVVVFVGNVF